MPEPRHCAECGAPLPKDVADDVCPACSFRGALALSPENKDASADSALRAPHSALGTLRYFGDYELLEEIARGGMGVVFQARQVSLNRVVAIKMILAGQLASEAAVERFRTEAEAAASLQHPNIVAIHEVGEHDGQHYFSMDYVEGKNLAELVRENPLPAERAAAYVRTIAEAIHYAHQHGTLHRDLKPSNVLIDEFDQPRITDFGLAKRLSSSNLETPNSELTLSGQVLGSPNFIPPEQASGKRVPLGPPSDVYGLGAILYHLLTGRPPFVADTVHHTLLQVLNNEPAAPRLLNPSVPRDLEIVCLKCLAKDPPRRYLSAQELAEELGRFLRHEPIHARPVSRVERAARWCRRHPAVAIPSGVSALLLLAVLIGSPIAAYRINAAREAEKQERTKAQAQTRRAEAEALNACRNLYDADMLLAQQALNENNLGRAQELLLKHRPDSSDSNTPAADLRHWEWRYLEQFTRGDQLHTFDFPAHSIAFAPDGQTFAAAGGKGVRLWEPATGKEVGILPHSNGARSVAFSRTGVIATGEETTGWIHLWDAKTLEPTGLITNRFVPHSLTFSFDSAYLAAAVWNTPGVRVWDMSTRKSIGWFQGYFDSGVARGMAFKPHSHLLAYDDRRGGIVVWDAAKKEDVTRLAAHVGPTLALDFSPDGTRLVSCGGQDKTLRLWDTANWSLLRSLTNELGFRAAKFLPDGKRLALCTTDQLLLLWDTEHWREIAVLKGHRLNPLQVDCSADGRFLATSSSDKTVRVWDAATRPADLHRMALPEGTLTRWQWMSLAPDGSALLAVSTNGACTLWDARTQRESARFRPSLPPRMCSTVAVAPGAALVAFGAGDGEIQLWSPSTRETTATLTGHTGRLYHIVFSLDGRRLASASDEEPVRVWDVERARLIATLESVRGQQQIHGLAFSRDGRTLAAGTFRGEVRAWDIATQRLLFRSAEHELQTRGVALEHDGKTLISGANTLKFHDLATGRLETELSPMLYRVWSLAVSPDGQRLAIGGYDGIVKVLDLNTRQELLRLKGHNDAVFSLAWTSGGDMLVSAGYDALCVWRTGPAASLKENP